MAPNYGASAAFSAPRVAQTIANEASDQKGWAERDPSKKSRPRIGQGAPDRAQSAPSRRRPVIAFRILEWVGEILVSVMSKMGGAVDRIGEPKRQRPAADRLIEAPVPRRMAMDSLVL